MLKKYNLYTEKNRAAWAVDHANLNRTSMRQPRHITFILIEEFSHLAFSCAVEPLRIANLVSGEDLYAWSFVSEHGEQAVCSNGSVTLVLPAMSTPSFCHW